MGTRGKHQAPPLSGKMPPLGWVLGLVLAIAHGKDCPISIPHRNEFSYICNDEDFHPIVEDDTSSRTPCASALVPAAAITTPNVTTVTCPDQTVGGITRRGSIKCLMYAGIGSTLECPTTDCDVNYFPDEHACVTCSTIGLRCNECEYLPRELGQACLGLHSCSVGVTAAHWVTAGGA